MSDYGIKKHNDAVKMNIARHFKGDDVINLNSHIIKGKAASEGEEREWGGKKYKKQGGKWIEVTKGREGKKEDDKGDKSKKQDDSKSKSSPQKSGELSTPVNNHEIAQMTHLKKVMDENPEKAYEIFQSLSPEAQSKVPQEVVNKLVEHSHTDTGEGAADDVFEKENDATADVFKDDEPPTADDNDKLFESDDEFNEYMKEFRETFGSETPLYQVDLEQHMMNTDIFVDMHQLVAELRERGVDVHEEYSYDKLIEVLNIAGNDVDATNKAIEDLIKEFPDEESEIRDDVVIRAKELSDMYNELSKETRDQRVDKAVGGKKDSRVEKAINILMSK